MKIVKERKLYFLLRFPLQFFNPLLQNFIFSPQFYYFPSSSSFYYIYFPSTTTSTPHRPYIDLTSTLHRPYIDPTLTLHRSHIDPTLNVFFFQHCFVNSETIYHHHHICIVYPPPPPPPPHRSLGVFTAELICIQRRAC